MCDRDCDVIVSQNYSTAKEVRKQVENSEQIKASIYNHMKKTVDSMGYSPHDKITNIFAHQIFIYV